LKPSLPPFKAIVFDMDGVLVDSEPVHEKAARVILNRHGLDVSNDVFDQFRGKPAWQYYQHVVKHYGNGKLDPAILLEEKQEYYRSLFHELKLIPGVLAFIRQIHPIFRLGLVTSGTRQNQQLVFEQFGLTNYFEATLTADDITNAKPHPEPYLPIADHLKVEPASCLVIEDAHHGVRSATEAGCFVAGLTSTFKADELRAAGADLIIDSFEDLAVMV
jgi:HAD superfamily hydrolase (TIGR01509 family)